MPSTNSSDGSSSQHLTIRKKYVWIGLLLVVVTAIVVFRILLTQGLWIGFSAPPPPAPPLSPELVSRLNQLEDKINESLLNVNDLFILKEKLEKFLPTNQDVKNKSDGKGGAYLSLTPLHFGPNYDADQSIEVVDDTLKLLQNLLPQLHKDLQLAIYLNSNLPEGVPLLGAYKVSSGFGERSDPFTSKPSFHPGVDFSADEGTPVLATNDGEVSKVFLKDDGGEYGKYIELSHKNNVVTKYGHLSEILVQQSQSVKKGDVLGLVGNTGRSTGPHLHFEILLASKPVDPMSIISPFPVKPNNISKAPLDGKARNACAPLLLIIKDETAPLMKECLASGGKNVNDILLSEQSLVNKRDKAELNKLITPCSFVDKDGVLHTTIAKNCSKVEPTGTLTQ
jgi:murein DD-endopeptidase MepM/ murein hydrolase activator NlpD